MWPRIRHEQPQEKPRRFNLSKWFSEAQARLRATSARARWTGALGLALALIFASLICTSGPIALALVTARPCDALPTWANYYLFLPPTLLVAGSLLASLLFGLRRSLAVVIGLLLVAALLCTLTYIAWFPLAIGNCI